MATSLTDLQSQVIELSTEAVETFCEDISGMFGIDMQCQQQESCFETAKGLNKKFKKLVAVNSVKSEGALAGVFQIMFDQKGLFTLAGVIVMLPEQRILQSTKHGSAKDAEGMEDAIGEAGNLLVGSWDRVFREGLDGHGHFVQTSTFIGNPWGDPQEKIGLAGDEEFLFIPYEMTIGSYPPFNCGVIFPKSIFEEPPAPDAEAATDEESQEEAEKVDSEESDTAAKDVDAEPAQQEENTTEQVTEAAGETKSDDADTASSDNAVEPEQAETAEAAEETKPATGAVSETIERMAQSPADLPGESASISLAMCAKDIMQKDVLWGKAEDSVQQAMDKMQQADAGYMMVGAEGMLEGILSRSDVTAALSVYLRPMFAKWRRSIDDATLQIRIKWIMTRPVQTIKPDITLAEILKNMRQSGVRCLPVVDQQGKVVGSVTVFDIFAALLSTDSGMSTAGKTPQGPPLEVTF
ncbi:MAG: hypothetical protein DRP66_02415 [Planctomycetota bacterium]|nr:MAG: hypothetical protein DRP66_02415 [Planctomycetota bacterium]